jgi:NAD(P)-dependent dehydrogenase (short-subunit alcohol dehydrogenase family)
MDTLHGKAYAITGGNSGIGRATAHELVRRGAQVAIFGRDRHTLDATQRELGASTLAVQGDVRRQDDLQRFFDAIARQFDGLHGVFVNAGIAAFAPLEQITDEQIASLLDVNFIGAVRTIQGALPLLHGGAAIVLTSSMYTALGMPGSSIYTASKAALESLARTLSAELVGRGIRVNAISPGNIRTPLSWSAEVSGSMRSALAISGRRCMSGWAWRRAIWKLRRQRQSPKCLCNGSARPTSWPALWPSCFRRTPRICWAKPLSWMVAGVGCSTIALPAKQFIHSPYAQRGLGRLCLPKKILFLHLGGA